MRYLALSACIAGALLASQPANAFPAGMGRAIGEVVRGELDRDIAFLSAASTPGRDPSSDPGDREGRDPSQEQLEPVPNWQGPGQPQEPDPDWSSPNEQGSSYGGGSYGGSSGHSGSPHGSDPGNHP